MKGKGPVGTPNRPRSGADGLAITPEVVVAVAVAFVLTYVLPEPGPKDTDGEAAVPAQMNKS